jgi:hypothetical protein
MPQSVKIEIIVEGATERVFLPFLRQFLNTRLENKMPKIHIHSYDGRIPTQDKLKRIVTNHLSGNDPADYVIALTDVYTGQGHSEFKDAADAKAKMRSWVGDENRFFPHAAQYDFEAWLLAYWDKIQRLANHNMTLPCENPENVNHDKPPAYWMREIFRNGKRGGSYVKPRDAGRILRESNLLESINKCTELKALVNTILGICGGELV